MLFALLLCYPWLQLSVSVVGRLLLLSCAAAHCTIIMFLCTFMPRSMLSFRRAPISIGARLGPSVCTMQKRQADRPDSVLQEKCQSEIICECIGTCKISERNDAWSGGPKNRRHSHRLRFAFDLCNEFGIYLLARFNNVQMFVLAAVRSSML